MAMVRALPKPVLYALAALFAASALFYGVLWTLYGSRENPVELGFEDKYLANEHADLVKSVHPGSPAERAGLKAGDRVIAVAGIPLAADDTMPSVWRQHHPGDSIELTVRRPPSSSPITLHGTFRLSESGREEASVVGSLGARIFSLYPFVFLTVGLAVLFLRVEDPNAWLLALLFGGFVAIPGFAAGFLVVPLWVRPFAMLYRDIFQNMVAGLFLFFFSVFPVRSPIDRRMPWLKWIALLFVAGVALLGLPAALDPQFEYPAWLAARGTHLFFSSINYVLIVLGFVSLIWNDLVVTSSDARRKIRVILWGTLLGVVPATLSLAAGEFLGYSINGLLASVIVILLWLFPLSFAYAVVKHRVLEIPVLLRRSARYLLVQRGFVILLFALSIAVTAIFARVFARYLQSLTPAALPSGIALGTVFGGVLLWTGAQVHKDVGRRIDRAFFRNAYDARLVLEQLLEKTRTVTDRKELASLIQDNLKQALQPSSVEVYLESHPGRISVISGDGQPVRAELSTSDPFFQELAKYGKPWDVSSASFSQPAPPPAEILPLAPECLVPIPGRDERLAGLIVLGQRLSEEPYSSEDKRLLALIAKQAGVALESILLAETIAERMEAERRGAQEMEFARQVQARLLPQHLPAMKTLDYIGGCVSARTVGGDYYDFLELRPGRLGMVLADIAGKGVPGALLMANLQANLRSQYAMAVEDLPRLLGSVNRLFFQNTGDASYATLFFADYDDTTRVLRYANCGHLPALLLHADGKSEPAPPPVWLDSTCTVLGLFENLQIEISEVTLSPGDTLALYTDGVTEAENEDGEEFGARRLVDALRHKTGLSAPELLQSVSDAVGRFSPGEQQDDITLIIARCVG